MTLLLFVILFVLSIQTSQSKITEITMVTSWVTLSMTVRSKVTRPDTWLPKSRAGGQGPYLRSLDHLGRSSEVRKVKS